MGSGILRMMLRVPCASVNRPVSVGSSLAVVIQASAAMLIATKSIVASTSTDMAYNLRDRGFTAQPLRFKSTTTVLAVRNSAISEKKKIKSRRSMTPVEIVEKCVRKLKDEIALMKGNGAQLRKKSSTSGAPEIVNRKHTATVTTNAMT